MNGLEISEKLWELYRDSCFSDNDAMEQISEQVRGTAFFPCGRGIFMDTNNEVDVLVLGQDFGTSRYFHDVLSGEKCDTDSMTWKNLIPLFHKSKLDLNRCFFSNVFMGVRINEKMIGNAVPKCKVNLPFVEENKAFLRKQIECIRPKAIITLGNYSTSMLIQSCDSGFEKWNTSGQVLKITENDKAVFGELTVFCAALLHPSFRYANLLKRKIDGHRSVIDVDVESVLLTEIVRSLP